LLKLETNISTNSNNEFISFEQDVRNSFFAPSLDISNIMLLKSRAQKIQRQINLGQHKIMVIEKTELSESISIRIFYSMLDLWQGILNSDFIWISYSLIRFLAEIPLFYCWSIGEIHPSYTNRLNVANTKTNIKQNPYYDLICYAVKAKTSIIEFKETNNIKDQYDFFNKTIKCYKSTILSLLSREDPSNLLLLKIQDSIDFEFKLNYVEIENTWKLYYDSIDDGKNRYRYLTNRVRSIISQNRNNTHYYSKLNCDKKPVLD